MMYSKSKTLFITFGRDANPRVMTESLSCGCFVIVLSILSDGLDVIRSNGELGCVVNVVPKFNQVYQSVSCDLTIEQCARIYSLVGVGRNHGRIAEVFNNTYNIGRTSLVLERAIRAAQVIKLRRIVTLATDTYANNLNYLLASIQYTNPEMMVRVHCVNWSKGLVQSFEQHYPQYQFITLSIGAGWVKGDIIKLKVKVQSEEYARKLPFVWIDADSIVLKSLDPLFEKIRRYGLVCYYRQEQKVWMRFAVGVIAFGLAEEEEKQKVLDEFVGRYVELVGTTEGYNSWFYDQTALAEAWAEFEDRLVLGVLGESEHSINDTSNTIVYSRRVGNKMGLRDILVNNNIKVPNIQFGSIKFKYQ